MSKNPTNFKITDSTVGWSSADFDDVFVRKDCFLEGGLWLWGDGNRGKLGNNSTANQSSPVQTVSGGNNWRSVSLGTLHSAAIKTDGSLWLWGGGNRGQLGNNSTTDRSSPVQTVSGGNNWRSVSLGGTHSAAIKTDGSLWLWGRSFCGAIGDNSTTSRSSPVQTVSGGTNWRSVSLGAYHSAAIKTDGSLWLWGSNLLGRLGDNSTTSQSSPVQTVSGGTNWRSVSLGAYHSAAIKTDGSLWLWGCNGYGRLGDNSLTDHSSPVQTVSGGTNWRSLSLSKCAHSAAIKTDGSLWLWGNNGDTRLGNGLGPTVNQSSPVQTVSGGTNWRSVSLGNGHSAAIKTDGSLWLWGSNNDGALGLGISASSQSSPVQTISGGNNWRSINLGSSNSAAIREDCW